MTTTSVKINLDLGDGETIKIGSTPSIADVISQADITDLATGAGVDKKWATFEPDMWLLDGNYHLLPETGAHVGVISGTISGSDGSFTVPPELTIDFDADYDLQAGITLKFSEVTGVYCNDLDIEFYDVGDSLLDNQNYTPDTFKYFCELPTQPLEDVRYIVITFNSANANYRHLRLVDVDVDTITFSGKDIKSANMIEEVNLIGTEIPISSLEFQVYSPGGEFNIIEPTGIYALLKNDMIIDVYEYINATEQYMGRFYLDTWDTVSSKIISIKANNILMKLEREQYLGGVWGLGVLFTTILADMLSAYTYSSDAFWNTYGSRGWIPITNLREALKQLSFSLGSAAAGASAVIQCNRTKIITITKAIRIDFISTYDFTISRSEQSNTVFTLKPLVTSVNLISHEYYTSAYGLDLYNTALDAGNYLITFRQPAHNLSISGATIISSGANYAYINVASAGTVALTGDEYADQKLEESESLSGTYSAQNEIVINDATMIGANVLSNKLAFLFDYYQLRYVAKFRLFAPLSIAPGDSVLMETDVAGKSLAGIVTKMSSNLKGGFVVDMEVEGRVINTP